MFKCVCVCTCICVRGFPCTYAWAELYYGMRFCSWCHFRLKEVKESLHCVPRSATQEFLIKPIVSKLHKLNCREQDSVCVPQDPVYILTFQHQFIQCPDIQFCFFFLFYFFVVDLFTSHLLSSLLCTVIVMIIKGTWLKVPDMPNKYNKISFWYFLLLNEGLVLLV